MMGLVVVVMVGIWRALLLLSGDAKSISGYVLGGVGWALCHQKFI